MGAIIRNEGEHAGKSLMIYDCVANQEPRQVLVEGAKRGMSDIFNRQQYLFIKELGGFFSAVYRPDGEPADKREYVRLSWEAAAKMAEHPSALMKPDDERLGEWVKILARRVPRRIVI
jgi:hypothetical protein